MPGKEKPGAVRSGYRANRKTNGMYNNTKPPVKNYIDQERQFLVSTRAVANGKVDRWRYECGRLAELARIGEVERAAAIDAAITIAVNNDIDERIGGLEVIEEDVRDAFAGSEFPENVVSMREAA
jgi:hypothetical protein